MYLPDDSKANLSQVCFRRVGVKLTESPSMSSVETDHWLLRDLSASTRSLGLHRDHQHSPTSEIQPVHFMYINKFYLSLPSKTKNIQTISLGGIYRELEVVLAPLPA